jgi:hypothetical protein
MHPEDPNGAERFFETIFKKLYPQMVASLREQYGVVRLPQDIENEQLGAGNVAIGSAFLTTFGHFQKGEFDGLTEEQLVVEFAHVVYKHWRRNERHRDRQHVSYDSQQAEGDGPNFNPAIDFSSPEDAAQFLEYFREINGKVKGRLTLVDPQCLNVVRAVLEKPGTQKEIATRCGCSQAKVSRCLTQLRDAINDSKRP